MSGLRKKKQARRRTQGPVNNYVGRKLRTIRLAQGMTYQEAARRAGIPLSSYSCLERGWYKINVDHLFRMAGALGIGPEEVWPGGNGDLSGSGDGLQPDQADRRAGRQAPAAVMEDVLQAVCEAFKVSPRKLLSGKRWSRLQEARAACGILVREASVLRLRGLSKRLGISESALGRLVRRHLKQAKEDPDLAARIESARGALKGSGVVP